MTGADPKFEIRVPSHFSGGEFVPETGLVERGHSGTYVVGRTMRRRGPVTDGLRHDDDIS